MPGLVNISDEVILVISMSATMKGKRRISLKKSSHLEVAAALRRISELLDEESLIEVASQMKTIDEEAQLEIMETIQSDMTTAVATLKKAVDTTGMGARYQRAARSGS